ncbi:Ferritin Dps family protein [Segniliparus rotundus DSM 44985]|uniref:Ferritin Dps family protein n=1 Tax=Segniliparus rotundus (strain ATCC BAA-972 / CDC 1076 / CIP 108378 / DSM 44985 / JCM 13578) TaxID=640132 RepID=D6ZEZ4_SEGRD|nr:DNA starvation/stationary phase protection protein [Segniliparus rotundus]ADG97518.1 Ferritin Dps family protein [Segniliparus rotundus DSM 44985]
MSKIITSPLSEENKKTTAAALQDALVNLIDLSLIGKQAHWNVVGSNFRSVHLQLDELIDLARGFSDDVAERISAIGANANGLASTIVSSAKTKGFATDFTSTSEIVGGIVDNLKIVIDVVREGIDATEGSDPVSQDLLIAVADGLEKQHWMWQAQEA